MRIANKSKILFFIFLSIVCINSCLADAAQPIARPGQPPVTIKIMTFNILHGGNKINLRTGGWCSTPEEMEEAFERTVEVIRQSGADIVGLQEADWHATRIAQKLGWHSDDRTMIISRFPLIDPPGGDGFYLFFEPSPGKIAVLANVHLNSEVYGPDLVRDGANAYAVICSEKALRTQEFAASLEHLQKVEAWDIPIIITGDFNTPSHLDWTKVVAASRKIIRYPLEWPTTVALEKAGYRDSYREMYSDARSRPGLTWTPGYPNMPANETHDRIDFIFAKGPAKTLSSQIVGESHGADVDLPMHPWPSDHRAVLTTFEIIPAEPPLYIAPHSRKVEIGEDLVIQFHSKERKGERIVVARSGQKWDGISASLGITQDMKGSATISTRDMRSGNYDVLLVTASNEILSRAPFWLYAKGQPTVLTSPKKVYKVGEAITVEWKSAPGAKFDWVGIFKANASNEERAVYEYTHATIEGTAILSGASANGLRLWPLPPGQYEIRFLADDTYQSIASYEFEIKP